MFIFKTREQLSSGLRVAVSAHIKSYMSWAIKYASDSMLSLHITWRVILFFFFKSYCKVQFTLTRFKTSNKNQNLNSVKCLGNFIITGKSNY